MAVNTVTAAALVSVLTLWAFGVGLCATPHHAPAPAVDCSSLVLNMADCLSYVTNGSTVEKPEGTCCSGLKTVLKADAQCVCEAFRNSAQFGVTLNVTKSMALPAACHVSAPSVSDCGLDTASGTAPALPPTATAMSPSSSTPAGPAPNIAAGENLSAPVPSPKSSGAALVVSIGTLVLALVAASFSSF